MILLAAFRNEMDAKLLESQLNEAGIDNKIEEAEGGETFKIMVFEDDLDEAKEIMESQDSDDDSFMSDIDDIDLDEFDDDDQ